ncbi:MAG: AmmeMemoRadiSam system protein B [Thermodesulfobacteriota bacterium]
MAHDSIVRSRGHRVGSLLGVASAEAGGLKSNACPDSGCGANVRRDFEQPHGPLSSHSSERGPDRPEPADFAPACFGSHGFVLSRRGILSLAATVPAAWLLGSRTEQSLKEDAQRPAMFCRKVRSVATVALVCALLVLGPGMARAEELTTKTGEKVRTPAVSGMFYPGHAGILGPAVDETLKHAAREPIPGAIKAIMEPHAGYLYCGKTMATAYKQIEGERFLFDTVVLLGPCHSFATKAAAVSSADVWETPLGRVPVDTALTKELVAGQERIEFDDKAHLKEHCLEVQLPYLIRVSRGRSFKIVPILTNSRDVKDQDILAKAVARISKSPRTLIVLSTDLSHYPSAREAEKVDTAILAAVKSLNVETVNHENARILKERLPGLSVTMCGLEPTCVLLRAAKDIGITHAAQLNYTHSGMVSGDDDRVVGYGAMVFTGASGPSTKEKTTIEIVLSEKSKTELIEIVRATAKDAVEGRSMRSEASDNPELQVKAGCFVTLKNKGRLRGCIGTFSSADPLWKTVREMAAAAATGDPRFQDCPITCAEFPELEVEISVLSPLKRVNDPLNEIELGTHGVVIEGRGGRGTFLPQVATETGWTLTEFLGHCARDKAGLGWEGWKTPGAKIYTYTATIVHETTHVKE